MVAAADCLPGLGLFRDQSWMQRLLEQGRPAEEKVI